MLDSNEWHSIDKELEEKNVRVQSLKVRFVRPINSKTYPLDCQICKNVVSSIEDMEFIKTDNCCEECYLKYYYKNKEEWKKGWRPTIESDI